MKINYRASLCLAVLLLGISQLMEAAAGAAQHTLPGERAHSRYPDELHAIDPLGAAIGKQNFSQSRFTIAPKISITEKQPKKFALLGNHPNPFNPKTTIEFELFQHGLVRLDIFNLVGRRVATLLNGPVDAGAFHTTWNGKDEDGNTLPSGIYVVYLQAGTQKASRSITLLK